MNNFLWGCGFCFFADHGQDRRGRRLSQIFFCFLALSKSKNFFPMQIAFFGRPEAPKRCQTPNFFPLRSASFSWGSRGRGEGRPPPRPPDPFPGGALRAPPIGKPRVGVKDGFTIQFVASGGETFLLLFVTLSKLILRRGGGAVLLKKGATARFRIRTEKGVFT